jgi:phosphoglycerol transferase MdoB-like AlkP superfamily enzyme
MQKDDNPVMLDVDLGFTKFKASRQAIIIFTLVLFIAIVGNAISLYTMRSQMVLSPLFFATITLFAVLVICYAILTAYIFNCVVVGKCIVLSWVFVGFYVFAAFVYIAIALGLSTSEAIGRPAIIEQLRLRTISPKKISIRK